MVIWGKLFIGNTNCLYLVALIKIYGYTLLHNIGEVMFFTDKTQTTEAEERGRLKVMRYMVWENDYHQKRTDNKITKDEVFRKVEKLKVYGRILWCKKFSSSGTSWEHELKTYISWEHEFYLYTCQLHTLIIWLHNIVTYHFLLYVKTHF